VVGERLLSPIGRLVDGRHDRGFGLGIVVEERSGHVRTTSDGSDRDLGFFAAEPGKSVVHAVHGGIGRAAARCQSRGCAWFGAGGCAHAGAVAKVG
jgi:hypothetical protein